MSTPVLARSRAVLESLEADASRPDVKDAGRPAPKPRPATPQLDLFVPASGPNPKERDVLETLRGVEVERSTPLDAMQLLARLKARLE